MSNVRNSDFLSHYGVKGMKWGVRRTKAALAKASADRKAARDPSTPEGAARAERQSASANRRTLADGDLDKFVARLEKEKKLKNLVDDDLNAGQKAAKAILSDTGKQVAKQVLGGVAIATVSVAVGNKLGDTKTVLDKDGNPLAGTGKARNTASEVAKQIKQGGKPKK